MAGERLVQTGAAALTAGLLLNGCSLQPNLPRFVQDPQPPETSAQETIPYGTGVALEQHTNKGSRLSIGACVIGLVPESEGIKGGVENALKIINDAKSKHPNVAPDLGYIDAQDTAEQLTSQFSGNLSIPIGTKVILCFKNNKVYLVRTTVDGNEYSAVETS